MTTTFTFSPLTRADLPRVHEWLGRPHVTAWWGPAPTLEEVLAEHEPHLLAPGHLPLDAPAGVVPYLALEEGEPFGYAQAYRVMAHQDDGWWQDERDPHALGIDQFIASPERLGQGLGTRMLRDFLAMLFADPRVTTIQTDPSPDNARAIASYRKAGFRDVGRIDTPDGPAWLMRIARPGREI